YGKESIDKASRTIESAGGVGDVRGLQPPARAHVGNARLRGFFFFGLAGGSLFFWIPPRWGARAALGWGRGSGLRPTNRQFGLCRRRHRLRQRGECLLHGAGLYRGYISKTRKHRKSPVRWRGGGSSPSRKRSASKKPRLRRRKSWTQTSLSVHAVTRSAP